MAQTGFTPIQLYSTSTAAAAPSAGNLTNSTLGSELAINITDGKLFYKDNANAVQVIGWKTVPTTAGGTGLTTYTAGDLSYYATGTTFTKLAIGTTGQVLTSTGSAPQWTTLSGVAVTTFSAGTTGFTPNSATSGAVTLAGTLITSNGGTGLSSYTAGDLAYYASGTALTKLAIGATGSFLSSTGSAPQWSAPAALTKTDDTNVTLTLGGSASTALLNAASLTLGWTGQLATSRGGTGLSAFTANGVFYASSTSAIGQSANLTFNGTTLVANDITDSSLTAGRITYAGTSGNLVDSANLTFSGTLLSVNSGLSNTVATFTTLNRLFDSPGNFRIFTANPQAVDLGASLGLGGLNGSAGAFDPYAFGVIKGAKENSTSGNLSGYLAFGTCNFGGTVGEAMRIHSSKGISIGDTTDPSAGNLRLGTGNLVIGTSGKGIDFSATAGTGTSELLADYEEGTWDPIIGGSGGSAGQVYAQRTGRYTKIGRMVYVFFDVGLSALTSITGTPQIQGLPFTAANLGGMGGVIQYFANLNVNVITVFPFVNANETAADLYKTTAAAATNGAGLANTDITATTRFWGTLVYQV
jgi:hypothetical protein